MKSILKKIALPMILAIIIGFIVSDFLIQFLAGYSIDPRIENRIGEGEAMKINVVMILYFIFLIVAPFLSSFIIKWLKIGINEWWKSILFFEFLGLIFSYLSTPPDLFSSILMFILFQPIVITNTIFIARSLRRSNDQIPHT